MSTPIWRGSRQIHLQPGYPEEVTTANGTRVTLVYEGPYATLRATKPRIGQAVVGFPGIPVDQCVVKPKEAGASGPGTLTITLANDSTPGDMITTGLPDIVEEVEWIDLARKLEQAPIYAAGGSRALTDADLDGIEEWRNADTREKRTSVYAALGANAKHYVDKLRRGQETFVMPSPVVRRTTKTFAAPSSTKMGRRVGKPSAKAPNGYEWLATADKATRTGGRGKWDRVEEFTGAEKWDADIYPQG
jgi:hypothetical protein